MKSQSITKYTLLAIFAMSVITAVTLNSCQKDIAKPKSTGSKGATSAINPTASSQQILEEINNIIFSSTSSGSSKGRSLNPKNEKGIGLGINFNDTTGGVIVTWDTLNKPDSIVYNYGTGCIGSDGIKRSGIVMLTYDVPDIRVVNNVFAVTLQNYTLSGVQTTNLNGTVSFTNTGTNSNGNLVIAETGGYSGTNGSYVVGINVNYQYEWLAGESSSPLANLQFKITGSTDGYASGYAAIDSITSPLIKNCKTPGCNYYIQGTRYSAVNDTSHVITINYGNPGGCSGQMEVTQFGVISIENQ